MADFKKTDTHDRGEIFGRSYDSITISIIREIMAHYSMRFAKHWLKPIYWAHFRTLENSLGKREINAVSEWLQDRYTLTFADHIRAFEENRAGSRRNTTQLQVNWLKAKEPSASSRVPLRQRKMVQRKTLASAFATSYSQKQEDGVLESSDEYDFETPQVYTPKKKALKIQEIECQVCSEDLPVDSFPKENITAGCEHEPRACLTCLSRHIKSDIQSGAWARLSCPECPELLDFSAVQKFASSEDFTRYDNLSTMAAMRDDSNFIMCLGPNCGSGQIHHGGDDQPIMTCNHCKFKTCATHKMPWHSGQTCADYDKERRVRVEEEAASEKFLKEKTKVCPNEKCGLHVAKISGCDHMTCHHCKFQFCWICLASYVVVLREGNQRHAESCKHYRGLDVHGRQMDIDEESEDETLEDGESEDGESEDEESEDETSEDEVSEDEDSEDETSEDGESEDGESEDEESEDDDSEDDESEDEV